MEAAKAIIDFIRQIFSWWFTVQPWEHAIFVRGGKHAKLISPGLYLKIPFLDKVFVQTTRTRMIDCAVQNLTTKDRQPICTKAALSYKITDLSKLYKNLYHPETTLSGMVMSSISDHVSLNEMKDLSQLSIKEAGEKATQDMENYGIGEIKVHLLCFSTARTYRIIQDQTWLSVNQDLKMEKSLGENNS